MANDPLDALDALIHSRKGQSAASSYTAKLFADGRAKIAQKVGEEAVETVIAAMRKDKKALTGEAADLVYHLLVLLADADLSLDAVRAELSRRTSQSGLAEKANRRD
ncbi:phosphoribosyl-ATP diphosphatase [Sphingomonas bacterium]|uniref:phosphoribosyl-ATP diphosphatase n=1 Tax=Sphingomonas bacterium TaxID=1895847 RepID=UPI00261E7D59|nr:phosphoribosyl-ATP diphosphatase [Sphingomonas bacterium]MDB5679387.1 phosphoribosyl-ATP diphosphatase [Sphingomonas bacterium]